jgi:hypothetical protein
MNTLHLCNTQGQLLIALCDVVRTTEPTTIVFLDDGAVITQHLDARLRENFAHLTLIVCDDAEMARQFSNLPSFFPDVVRRNIRWNAIRPNQWHPDILAGQHYDHAYVHNTGFFMAKVVSGLSDTLTLRESGLNNYIVRPVTGLKRIIRWLANYPSTRQILGEEPWVDDIAVSRPLDLPSPVRHKGAQYDLPKQLTALTLDQKQALLDCLEPNFPTLQPSTRNALLLAQPLDQIGMCNSQKKLELYSQIALQLTQAGYDVFLKSHPLDSDFKVPHTTRMPPRTPIELWPLTSNHRFDFGIAVCSAALSYGADLFCTHSVQLVAPDRFYPSLSREWMGHIPYRLEAALAS